MASELRTKMNELYPVRQWDINTVADGKLFTYSSVNTLANRDDFIADEFGKYQQQLNTEIAARTYKDTELAYKANAEIQARKNADQQLLSDLAAEENKFAIHEAQRSENDGSTDAHLTKESYDYLHEQLSEVAEPNLSQWSSITALNGLTDETITLTGSKYIDVTATSDSDITIGYKNPGTTPIGENTGVYLSNGEFIPVSIENESRFGNAIISLHGDSTNNTKTNTTPPDIISAAGYCYVNDTTIPTTITATSTYMYDQIVDDTPLPMGTGTGLKPGRFITNDIISKCLDTGVNNFVIRYDDLGLIKDTHNNVTFEEANGISDLTINIEKLDKYKLYTLNLVPLDYELINRSNANEATYNFTVSFSAAPNKFIDFSSENYKVHTFGYHYNVPAFGINNIDRVLVNLENSTTPSQPYKYWISPHDSDGINSILPQQYYQTYLNDTSYQEYKVNTKNVGYYKVNTDITMYTIQPHSEFIDGYSEDPVLTITTGYELEHAIMPKLGSNKISAVMMTAKFDGSDYDKKLFRRQIAFMRGPDLVAKEAQSETKTPSSRQIANSSHTMQITYENSKISVEQGTVKGSVATAVLKLNGTAATDINDTINKVKIAIRNALRRNTSSMPDSYFSYTVAADNANHITSFSYKTAANGSMITLLIYTTHIMGGPMCFNINGSSITLLTTSSWYGVADSDKISKEIYTFFGGTNISKSKADLENYIKNKLIELNSYIIESSITITYQQVTGESYYNMNYSYNIAEQTGYTIYFFSEATY